MAIGNRPLISADSHVAETEDSFASIERKYYDRRPRAAYHLEALGASVREVTRALSQNRGAGRPLPAPDSTPRSRKLVADFREAHGRHWKTLR